MTKDINKTSKFIEAVYQIFESIDKSLPDCDIKAVIAGGVATHIYTNMRVSDDIDVVFSHRILVPQDLIVHYKDENNTDKTVYFDYNYNDSYALMHPDYMDNAVKINWNKSNNIKLYALSPVDLVISKLLRYIETDQADIRKLCELALFSSEELEQKINEALDYYIGNMTFLKHNIDDTLALKKEFEEKEFEEKELKNNKHKGTNFGL